MPTISEIIEELKKSGVNSKQRAIEMLEALTKGKIVLVLDKTQEIVLRNHLFNCRTQYEGTYQGSVLESILQAIQALEVKE